MIIETSAVSILDIIALSGGLLVVLYIIFESIVRPIERHLYKLELIESLFFVGGASKTRSGFEKDQSLQHLNAISMAMENDSEKFSPEISTPNHVKFYLTPMEKIKLFFQRRNSEH